MRHSLGTEGRMFLPLPYKHTQTLPLGKLMQNIKHFNPRQSVCISEDVDLYRTKKSCWHTLHSTSLVSHLIVWFHLVQLVL